MKSGDSVGTEYLSPMVTPIEQSYQGDGFSVSVHDMLCDGALLSLAWSYTNDAAQEPLFFYCELGIEDDVHVAEASVLRDGGGTCLIPQATVQEGGRWTLNPILENGDTLPIVLKIDVLKSKAPIEHKDLPDSVASKMTDADWKAYEAQSKQAMRDGKLLVENGVALVPSLSAELEEALLSGAINQAQAIIGMGLMERVDQFELKIPVTVHNERKSALSDDQPIEKQMDGYTMRITRADLYPSTTELELEYIFDSKAEMLAFAKTRPGWFYNEDGEETMMAWVGCYAGVYEEVRLNGTEDPGERHLNGFQSNTKEVYQREDGKWVVPLHQHSTPVLFEVTDITIVPCAYEWISDTQTREHTYWEDSMTIHFGE